jgi:mono/diheme cytochrome c family protein
MRFNRRYLFAMVIVSMAITISLAACGQEEIPAIPETSSATVTPQPTTVETIALDELALPDGMATPAITPPPVPLEANDARFPVGIPEGEAFSQAAALFAQHCAECHGANGEGQQPDPYAPGMAPPHNNDGHTWHHPDQVNFATVWNGTQQLGGKMPGFHDQLTADEVVLVLGYLKQWWSADAQALQRERTTALIQGSGSQ